jgi:tRNA (cytidine32/uridine32-2'-O)-methyltransferase
VLELPIHRITRFVLVRPHYPENVGAAARAIKTMGFTRLTLVKPGRLAVPEHEMAHKMAVKAWDVLEQATRCDTLADALAGVDRVFATTSRRGVSGVLTARQAGARVLEASARNEQVAILFGNEKTGLSQEDLAQASAYIRIPMAADQPSINLAQATQVIAYELFVAALEVRNAAATVDCEA